MSVAINNLNRLMMLLCLISVSAAVTQPAQAAAIVAASCSRTDVGTAVASAANGDTVIIPAGTCSWSSTLPISKGITLQGAGESSTILQDNVNKGLGSNGCNGGPLMDWTVNTPNTFRLTGLKIQGVATDPDICQTGHVKIHGTTHGFRIDHITIDPALTVAIFVIGDLWGLIDHYTFHGGFKQGLRVEHAQWNGAGGAFGDQSWAQDIHPGSAEGVYVEDSSFTDDVMNTAGSATDCFEGGRIVFRHNTVVRQAFTTHGTDSDQRNRACRWVEVYNNTFTMSFVPLSVQIDFIAWIRGGSGVFYNNTITTNNNGLNKVVSVHNCRDADAGCGGGPNYTPWGACDGTGTWDQNTPGQSGYLCVDQPGSGTSHLVSGNPPSPAAWIGNINEPVYVWNNTVNGSSNNTTQGTSHVQVNRDYFTSTARPEYSPYTYPHPLQDGGSPPNAPSNLTVAP